MKVPKYVEYDVEILDQIEKLVKDGVFTTKTHAFNQLLRMGIKLNSIQYRVNTPEFIEEIKNMKTLAELENGWKHLTPEQYENIRLFIDYKQKMSDFQFVKSMRNIQKQSENSNLV